MNVGANHERAGLLSITYFTFLRIHGKFFTKVNK